MSAILVLCSIATAAIAWVVVRSSRRNNDIFKNKYIVITGGSQGFGKAIGALLAKEASRITLWARGERLLKQAVAEIKGSSTKGAAVDYKTVDVTDYEQVDGAAGGEDEPVPDFVFCCAGGSRPGWFLRQPLKEMHDGMQLNYFGTLHTARAYAQRMIDAGKKGRIVFVSSTVGLMGMVGFSQYSPAKFALRGLAECLNQEFYRFGISFHVYFVASIKTPGYEAEQVGKPEITKELEGSDISGDQSADAKARILLDGLKSNQIFIASDFFTRLLLVTSEGFNLRLKEIPVALLGWMILPIVRIYFKVKILNSSAFSQMLQ